jgi:hypothetical protein
MNRAPRNAFWRITCWNGNSRHVSAIPKPGKELNSTVISTRSFSPACRIIRNTAQIQKNVRKTRKIKRLS